MRKLSTFPMQVQEGAARVVVRATDIANPWSAWQMTAAINIANGWKHIACQIAFLMRQW
jgi:hypothetical protein